MSEQQTPLSSTPKSEDIRNIDPSRPIGNSESRQNSFELELSRRKLITSLGAGAGLLFFSDVVKKAAESSKELEENTSKVRQELTGLVEQLSIANNWTEFNVAPLSVQDVDSYRSVYGSETLVEAYVAYKQVLKVPHEIRNRIPVEVLNSLLTGEQLEEWERAVVQAKAAEKRFTEIEDNSGVEAAAREWHWLRMFETEDTLIRELHQQGATGVTIDRSVNQLRRRAGLPVSGSGGRLVRGEADLEGGGRKDVQKIYPREDGNQEANTETTKRVEIITGRDRYDPHRMVHLFQVQLRDGRIAGIGTVPHQLPNEADSTFTGGAVIGTSSGETQNYFQIPRAPEEVSIFDNTGMPIAYPDEAGVMNEQLAVVSNVEMANHAYQTLVHVVDTGTGKLITWREIEYTQPGDMNDYSGAGRLKGENLNEDRSMLFYTDIDGEGFNQALWVYNPVTRNFENRGLINRPEQTRATQFCQLIGGNAESGEAWFGMTDYSRPIGDGLAGIVVGKNVSTGEQGGSAVVMEIPENEILDEVEGFDFRVYSLIRYGENPIDPTQVAAVAPVRRNGGTALRIEVRDKQGQRLVEPMYLDDGGSHQVIADIKFTQEGDLVVTCLSGNTAEKMNIKVSVLPRIEENEKPQWSAAKRVETTINDKPLNYMKVQYVGDVIELLPVVEAEGERFVQRWPTINEGLGGTASDGQIKVRKK